MWKLSPKSPVHSSHPDFGVALPVAPALPAEGDGKVELQDPGPGMGEKGESKGSLLLRVSHPWGRISGGNSVGFKGSWIYPAALGHGGLLKGLMGWEWGLIEGSDAMN